ncbi:competence/damage-inducible protein A [Nevskia soli]|jgi:nicotinamide-nucleotide amidase|uniref:competence/damage-inducible protein A n=1 Tax=Nevskia soli TaxID=418856 RepID=UPI0015D6C5B6|nr:competence/damage-inducible protein A [Nevskia soli]
MNAEIIAVGSELLTPDRVDTNSLFLTEELNKLGVEVTTKYVVGDDRERLAYTVRTAAERSDFTIVSGGLGPTEDDVTREAVAMAIDRRMTLNQGILDGIEQRFRTMGWKMPEINRRQALIIDGAEVLPNDRGTAPGQWIDVRHCSVLLLPGPPHELKSMFVKQCLPRVERRVPKMAIETLILRVAGMSESDLDQTISPVYKQYSNPVTTVLAHAGDIQVHLRARCATTAEAMTLLAEVGGKIDALLGDRIYSRNGDPLEVVVGQLLKKPHATLVVAESITGGMLAERITTVPGCSEYFLGGFITYSRKLKNTLLGVPLELIEQHGAVSRETAEAMAIGARNRSGATHALAITGNAGPTTDGDTAPVGMVYVSLADLKGVITVHRQFSSDRERIRQFSSQMALDLLRKRLIAV